MHHRYAFIHIYHGREKATMDVNYRESFMKKILYYINLIYTSLSFASPSMIFSTKAHGKSDWHDGSDSAEPSSPFIPQWDDPKAWGLAVGNMLNFF
jgi:hypothetical protein